ncbi:hypothetical protein TWF730_008329 [Orbilia blumenaviensis]|uniref:Uncharacterized protein n=1 Tax=Orbilia blumenaviensis TaxID=1796055 RepID=A0AAV9V582_9PEZI
MIGSLARVVFLLLLSLLLFLSILRSSLYNNRLTRLSIRSPPDDTGSGRSDQERHDDSDHETGLEHEPDYNFDHVEYKTAQPMPWVILLKPPNEITGTKKSQVDKLKFTIEDMQKKNVGLEYCKMRGLSITDKTDIWYFCIVTSPGKAFNLHREDKDIYTDPIASIRPLTFLYPHRKLEILSPSEIQEQKRSLLINGSVSGETRPRLRGVKMPLIVPNIGKREGTGQLRAPRELQALSIPPWVWGHTDWDKINYNFDITKGPSAELPVVVYVICKGVDITHPARPRIARSSLTSF